MSLKYNGCFYRWWLLYPLWYPQGSTVQMPADSELPTHIRSERGEITFCENKSSLWWRKELGFTLRTKTKGINILSTTGSFPLIWLVLSESFLRHRDKQQPSNLSYWLLSNQDGTGGGSQGGGPLPSLAVESEVKTTWFIEGGGGERWEGGGQQASKPAWTVLPTVLRSLWMAARPVFFHNEQVCRILPCVSIFGLTLSLNLTRPLGNTAKSEPHHHQAWKQRKDICST